MALKLENPVQDHMAVALLNSPYQVNREGDRRSEGKLPNKRRVFIQTESGCVLGMELDRKDNAHIVKRRMQLTLNVPTDESSLTFGDMVLNNDLSSIRNDSALLLTKNLMHRSSSTPCLSPTGKALQQRDQSGVVEILGHDSHFARANELVKEIMDGLRNGVEPVPVNDGLGGAYYFKNLKGECIAIVKPADEEPFAPNNPKGFIGKALGQPGLKHSVRVGETGFREVAAYLLDHDHFAHVPLTSLVKITHSIFNLNDCVNGNKIRNKNGVSKIASLQQFIPHDFDASDHGTSRFPVADVHRIGILDVRIFNTDRHAGNLLVRKHGDGDFGQIELIPIDHGLCLPECLEDPYFEWIHWPQASIPFSDDELEYIRNLDVDLDSEMLKTELPMIREACLRVLTLCTTFLQAAAAFGLCLAEIGEMMSREFRCKDEEPSELESICLGAMRHVTNSGLSDPKEQTGDDQSDIGLQDSQLGCSPPFKLDESLTMVPSLTFAFKNSEKGRRAKAETGSTGLRRSAKELMPMPTSFVKVAEMNGEEWWQFLGRFKELLEPAFGSRKNSRLGVRRGLRLGTSCQF